MWFFPAPKKCEDIDEQKDLKWQTKRQWNVLESDDEDLVPVDDIIDGSQAVVKRDGIYVVTFTPRKKTYPFSVLRFQITVENADEVSLILQKEGGSTYEEKVSSSNFLAY